MASSWLLTLSSVLLALLLLAGLPHEVRSQEAAEELLAEDVEARPIGPYR